MLGHIDSLPSQGYSAQDIASESSPANSPVPIYCTPCGPNQGGGFAPGHGVILCQDRLMGKKHVEDTLAHELIHEWDHRRFKVDWSNLRHLACSEVRLHRLLSRLMYLTVRLSSYVDPRCQLVWRLSMG